MTLTDRIVFLLSLLEKATKDMPKPLSRELEMLYGKDPFIILIGCLLSLRARDVVTIKVCKELFARVRTPQELVALPRHELEQILRHIGFFRKKAQIIQSVAEELITRFKGTVPHKEEQLLSIKGVGRKTANLVLGEAFGIPAICVDVHVHQVSNRLGWVATKTVNQTEEALMKVVPEEYWISLNFLLVTWGQMICVSVSPKCSQCVLLPWCPQIGVTRHR